MTAIRLRKALVAVSSLLVAGSLGGCALSLQSLPEPNGISGPSYQLHAVFANVLNLPIGAQVRSGAEVVGDVSSIAARDFKAYLTLSIDKGVRIRVGTTAQIQFDNPLGDEYVLLNLPLATASGVSTAAAVTGGPKGYLRAGGVIPISSTSTAPSVEDTLGALALVLNGGGLNQLQTIIHELNNTFNGNQPQIRSFLTTIDGGLKTVDGGRASIDDALTAIKNLTVKLSAGGSTISHAITGLAPAIGVLAGESHQISELLSGLSQLGSIGEKVAVESGEYSVQDAKDLLPVVDQLQSVTSQLAPDLQVLANFEAETPKVAPGDYLQVDAIVKVILPAGAFEPGGPVAAPGSTSPSSSNTAGVSSAPASGTQAVGYLLGAGLG